MPFTILRTAVGSAASLFALKALKSIPNTRVIAADADPLSFGFHFADARYIIPLGALPDFVPAIQQICQKEQVNLILPAVEEEVAQLAAAKSQFRELGVVIPVPDSQAVEICQDKYLTYNFLRDRGIPTPQTFLPEQLTAIDAGTYIVKPRKGRGSQNVYKAKGFDQTAFFSRYVPNAIVQEFIEGTEYSVDTLSDLEGQFLYCSVRERIATESGISSKGRTLRHPVIESYSQKIANTLALKGPACMQCIVSPDGAINFIEINLRVGGGAALSIAAGAPLVSDLVKLAQGQPIEGMKNYREGTILLRYWQELFLETTEYSRLSEGESL